MLKQLLCWRSGCRLAGSPAAPPDFPRSIAGVYTQQGQPQSRPISRRKWAQTGCREQSGDLIRQTQSGRARTEASPASAPVTAGDGAGQARTAPRPLVGSQRGDPGGQRPAVHPRPRGRTRKQGWLPCEPLGPGGRAPSYSAEKATSPGVGHGACGRPPGHATRCPRAQGSGVLDGTRTVSRAAAWGRCAEQHLPVCTSRGPPPPHLQTGRAEDPYQFFKTRVVIRAAMTMMRETVMVTIWWTARPGGREWGGAT